MILIERLIDTTGNTSFRGPSEPTFAIDPLKPFHCDCIPLDSNLHFYSQLKANQENGDFLSDLLSIVPIFQ